jgi:integrase
MGFTGLRWGEVVGLVTQYVRQLGIRVERQLYELDNGGLHRCPPKDESRRLVMTPAWLVDLAKDHIAHTRPAPCSCHGMRYVFSGHRPRTTPHVRRARGWPTWPVAPASRSVPCLPC